MNDVQGAQLRCREAKNDVPWHAYNLNFPRLANEGCYISSPMQLCRNLNLTTSGYVPLHVKSSEIDVLRDCTCYLNDYVLER